MRRPRVVLPAVAALLACAAAPARAALAPAGAAAFGPAQTAVFCD
jgi:hypothetical protein